MNAFALQDEEKNHQKTIWTRYVTILLGVWLVLTPLSFSSKSFILQCSDIVSGLLLVLFGFCSLSIKKIWAPWAVSLVGIWLQFAPLLLKAQDTFVYLNDTLVGALAIALAILIPSTPGDTTNGPEVPPGWSYNPSSWLQRLPIIFFGFTGWFIARYMAAYQMGYLNTIWDPIFGDQGTLKVITSDLSKSFPISDAGLGALAYTLEALMACKGSSRRWQTMPWMVIFFGILVVPLGFVSILLIICQPLIVGHWCFWCLLTALCMLMMIALTIDEVFAVLQHLWDVKKSNLPFWKIFWQGGALKEEAEDMRSPKINTSLVKTFPAMTWGVTIPWNLLVTALIGAWLMLSPPIFGIYSHAANSHYILGALTVAISVIAMAEVVRSLRFVMVLFGIGVIFSSLFLEGETAFGLWDDLALGIALIVLSFPRGKIVESYGSWNRYII